jgi:glucan phosphoethanolaminetransferase (alkaline phosphatase superfamily)
MVVLTHTIRVVLFILFLSLFNNPVFAQTFDTIQSEDTLVKTDTSLLTVDDAELETDTGTYNFLSQKEFWLSVIVLGLLLVVLTIEAIIISRRNITEEAAIKLVLVTIVLLGAIFLFVAGYRDSQIAPAFALFGTICGYIFGKSSNNNSSSN